MRALFATVLFWLLATTAQAATLLWDAQTIASPLIVEKSATATGTFTTVATLPTGATSYILTPGDYGFYRVRYSGITNAVPSNVVQFSADLFTGPVTLRLDALEASGVTNASNFAGINAALETFRANLTNLQARVTTLEAAPVVTPPPPAPSSNLTVRQIDADHIEITCNGIGISTTGTGLHRVLTCKH